MVGELLDNLDEEELLTLIDFLNIPKNCVEDGCPLCKIKKKLPTFVKYYQDTYIRTLLSNRLDIIFSFAFLLGLHYYETKELEILNAKS